MQGDFEVKTSRAAYYCSIVCDTRKAQILKIGSSNFLDFYLYFVTSQNDLEVNSISSNTVKSRNYESINNNKYRYYKKSLNEKSHYVLRCI